MAKTTIVTKSGQNVTGEVVRRETEPMTAIEFLIGAATLGLSVALTPDTTTTTVKDSRGNYWTGREK